MKNNLFSVTASLMILALTGACTHEEAIREEDTQSDDAILKSAVADSSLSPIPEITVEDSVLLDLGQVSQNREDFIYYVYDRSGRLTGLNYYRRNTDPATDAAETASVDSYMSDRFEYNPAGRLAEMVRYARSTGLRPNEIVMIRSYLYDKNGNLVVIATKRPDSDISRAKTEHLEYDSLGQMIRKTVKQAGVAVRLYKYAYDKAGLLVNIACYRVNANLPCYFCKLNYDNRGNIESKEFFYPLPMAASIQDVYRKWVVKYRYDTYYNPFREFKLPVSSLNEWMDLISPGNMTAAYFNDGSTSKAVFYKYRYNDLGYPVLRARIRPDLAIDPMQ